MTFAELLAKLKFIISFNDGQADQDFSEVRLKELLNMAYAEEVAKAKQEGLKRYFKAYVEATWSSGDVTFTLPGTVKRAQLISIRDVTSSEPGGRLVFSEDGLTGDVHWKDRNTLQWIGDSGPGSDKTLRFFYFARAETLVEEDDEPTLIPDEHHMVLPWAAAVLGRIVADEAAPPRWESKLNELRIDLWKDLSRGRPTDDTPWIDQEESDVAFGEIV